ncbi:peptide chain release factor N(5)-glutamine methyltransferase [Rufibacter latericius]|uniref:Release factor glutamine methyltransferase n=1 Tax=Rufibacter latericius TaxID=2487040 RepID=A0A3M9MPA8_9BACT|nr:peptide chain release factor N(5)-glutamine methyltransferase [Rufibacter latericius]RNI27035.1 peptide chain release factor N(5)-glutamine methyltransferase [Rufibacter latericius]
MQTIEALLENLARQLEAFYEKPEARTIADWVLEHALGVGRFELLQRRREEASTVLEKKVQGYQERLLRHEPLQYVLGEASFYGREFVVTPSVLIPRPETEELVQRVIKTYQHQQGVKLLDIGTGSGCIPITLAAELPSAEVWGLDVSIEALAVAKLNAEKLQQRVTWLQYDILRELPAIEMGSLDAVISNPPYVLEDEKTQMRQNVLDFEPHLALFVPNHDPLLFYRRIALVAQQFLKRGGKLFFEINERFSKETLEMLQEMGYENVQVYEDLRGKDRILVAVWR